MKRWKLIAGIFLVFVLGALSGTLGTGLFIKQKMKPFRQDPKERRTALIEKLTRRLDLEKPQIPKIENILNELDQRRGEYRREFRRLRTESIARMKQELTPQQQKKLDLLHQEWERRKKKWRSSEQKK